MLPRGHGIGSSNGRFHPLVAIRRTAPRLLG
jgi:hypothetical protein